jgi:hypothetical protein
MSLAGFNLFKNIQKQCYYINTEDNEYIKFDFVTNTIIKQALDIKCELKDILMLNAQKVEFSNFKIAQAHKQLIHLLENNESLSSKLLPIINKINLTKNFNKEIDNGKLKGSLFRCQNNSSFVKIVMDDVTLYEHQESGEFLIDLLFGKWFE